MEGGARHVEIDTKALCVSACSDVKAAKLFTQNRWILKYPSERMARSDDVEVPNIDSPYTSDITLVQHLLKTNSDLNEDYVRMLAPSLCGKLYFTVMEIELMLLKLHHCLLYLDR